MAALARSPLVPPRRILVRGADGLGDAVMTTPALLRLRERFPEAHITLLTREKLADLWWHHPALDEVITFGAGEGPFAVAQRLHSRATAERLLPLDHDAKAAVGRVLDRAERQHQKLTWATLVYGTLNTLWETAASVVSNRFDVALVLPNSPRSALEVWLARVPQRIGYARKWGNRFLTRSVASGPGRLPMRKRSATEIRQLVTAGVNRQEVDRGGGVLTPATPGKTNAHQVHEYLHLAAALGADPTPLPPRLEVSEEEVRRTAGKFGLTDLMGGDFLLLGLNPAAGSAPAKRWPADRFIEVAALVQRRVKCRWLVFGGLTEAALAEKVAADIAYEAERPPTSGRLPPDHATVNLAGKTSLRELMALLKLCRVVLTNSTGPMHLAAALDTPVVATFGSATPEHAGPGLPGDPRHRLLKSDVPCSPCFLRECPIDLRCLSGISVEQVAEAVVDALHR